MTQLSILKFAPMLKTVIWGGNRLASTLGKPSSSVPVGESWELCDLPEHQSRVDHGPMSGKTLTELLECHRTEIMGNAALLSGRFPLLFKYIDARKTLSVQVHPDEAACTKLGDEARPKTEAWLILDAEPGAVLYAGVAKNVDHEKFERALQDGTVEECLNAIPVSSGDYVFIPAGIVHAIGAGIVLAEVQQSSNTTYRVFDWNRVDTNGKPRELHIESALASIDFSETGTPQIVSPPSGRPGVACDYFTMETVSLTPHDATLVSTRGPVVVMRISGDGVVQLDAGGDVAALALGETALIPACLAHDLRISAMHETDVLVVTLPVSVR